MNIYAIRGAITVKENNRLEILNKTKHLLSSLLEANSLEFKSIISIIFTGTKDITAVYPAVAAREMGMTHIPLMCFQEMDIDGSLPLCIRVMLHVQLPNAILPKHIYLEGARVLRPDLITEGSSGYCIAIDGPAGAGKSTIAKMLANKLNIHYLDTGAMYRGIAFKLINQGADMANHTEVIDILKDTDIRVSYEDGVQKIYLDNTDITDKIRTNEISKAASAAAVIPEVRLKLVELQRKIAQEYSLVMDGRDIGTYVLPNANIKIFLTASVEERARRRWAELKEKNQEQDFNIILQDIIDRDQNDTNRSFAPLKKADDAILVDTTGKSIDEVIYEIEKFIV